MKYRIREEFDPRFPHNIFYYVEKKVLGLFWQKIKMTADLSLAHMIYHACITARYSTDCTNKIIAQYP